MKILLKNGTVVRDKSEKLDIYIEDGKIVEIAKDIEKEADEIHSLDNMHVLPGLIDAHCHLRDPGQEYKEDIESGTLSALEGGFTSIACMPNTDPVIDNDSMITYILEKAADVGHINVFPIGAVSKNMEGKKLSEIGEMKKAGAVAISDDGKPVLTAELMMKAMKYANMFDLTVISHCEELTLAEDGVMNEGVISTLLGLKGIPSASEEIMVAREILLSEYLNIPVHIAHVSSHTSIELIRNAKKRGVKVTCETCPHYFTLTEKACEGFNTFAKVNPPLKTEIDVEAVINGVKDGTIDMIATDHAPHHIDEKNVEFNIALNGLVGFETALSLALTYLVKPGHLSIEELAEKMSTNPSKLLNLESKGVLAVGKDADITVVDMNKEYVVDIEKFSSKSKNSPFDGMKLKGKQFMTIIGGKTYVCR